MKKILIIYVFLTVLSLMASPVVAQPTLNFDFDNDWSHDSSWVINGKQTVEIYLDDWPWLNPAEDIIGALIYFYYDNTKIKVNGPPDSFANDTDHGGEFHPGPAHSWFKEIEDGKIELQVLGWEAGWPACAEITNNRILLWTLELESIAGGISSIFIRVDRTGDLPGAISPGGADCLVPHLEDAVFGQTQITTSEPEPIPTLSEWGMIIFMFVIMGTGVMILRKRRMVKAYRPY